MNKQFLLILLSLSFSGCSLLYSYSDNLPQRLDQWVSEKKYNVALNTIDYIKPDHKDYRTIQVKKKLIKKQMNAYESTAIEKSTLLASKGNWIKALKLLEEVADNIIDEENIKKHQAYLLSKRHAVISAYEKDILYNQATNLAAEMELYREIKKTVTTDEKNQLNISEFDDLREKTTIRLATLSEQQFKNRQYNNALNTISFALKLNPNNEIVIRLKIINKRIKEATKLQKESYLKEAKALLSKLSQGYSHAILNKTKTTIIWLNKNKDNNKSYQNLINKLEKHLATGIKQRFEAARNLYSKGKTQEALSIWLELKELDPDNAQLQSHIERAKKVLLKLKRLSNKPKK